MENHNAGIFGLLNTAFWSVIAWISIHDTQVVVSIVASCIAGGSGILAGRYYWYAAQEKKRSLKKPTE